MVRPNHGLEHAAYLKGDGWKCSSSPTGAHHWRVGRHESVCKYCLLNNSLKPTAPAGTVAPAGVVTPPTP